jgi:hypothetical protein
MIYLAGLDVYGRTIDQVLEDGETEWAGFDVVKE